MNEEWVNDKLSRRMAVGRNQMLTRLFLKRGAKVPPHKHVSEQISYVVTGAIRFTIKGKKIDVRSGEVLVIPPNVIHAAEALEDTDDFDCFSPIRQDWLDGTDTYLRTGRSELKRNER